MINILLSVFIIIVIIYPHLSGRLDGLSPVECTHVTASGEECRSCGLTRSFAEMARGNFSDAAELNRSGPLIFGFFLIQLVMRALFGFLFWRGQGMVSGGTAGTTPVADGSPRSTSGVHPGSIAGGASGTTPGGASGRISPVILADIVISVILFLLCFRHLLVFW